MSECEDKKTRPAGECLESAPAECSSSGGSGADSPLAHFGRMIQNCLEYASAAKESGRGIVGIMCEFTPRELILAAGGVPVCLCGGSAETIAPAEEHLPVNLCPLIKSTFGFHVEGANPFLEMADLIVAETTCDGKKKMYELMAESRPMYVLELPQKQDSDEGLEYWTRELGKLRDELERRFAADISDDKLHLAIATMNRERALRRELAELMKSDCPPLTGLELLGLKSIISGIPGDLREYEKAIDALRGKSGDPELASRVRVLMTGVPIVHGAERVVEIVEDHGGLVVCMENCTGIKPILEDVDTTGDPLRALAEKYYHLHCSVMTPNTRRLDALRRLAREYRAECVIDLIWQACLTYDVESRYVKRLAEEELGVPYLRIETDYSPSDSARIAVRVEATFETARSRERAGRERGGE